MDNEILKAGEHCTACGACISICPTQSIYFVKDDYDNLIPKVKKITCVNCNKCNIVCPANKKSYFYEVSQLCYAAWTFDDIDRKNSASGGVASAIYKYCLKNKYKSFGVEFLPGKNAEYVEVKDKDDIKKCQNSKYVYSYIYGSLDKIKKYVDKGEMVIIPALPCQAASIISYCGGRKDNLYIIDIVCHGVCSENYINQHIKDIEKYQKKISKKIYFRDVIDGTDKFVLSLYNENERFYKAKVNAQDVYQLGYHKALIYRENCYKCEYAMKNRVGDLTISDFSGLGNREKYNNTKQSVSCILVNSNKGKELLKELQAAKFLNLLQRPIEEAFLYEKQLQHPSIPHKKRKIFKETYKITKNYDYSAKVALKKELLLNRLHYYEIRKFCIIAVSKVMPRKLKDIVNIHIKKDKCN